jgi:glycosyltransferase involved in cell wall biosynthesis
VRVLFLTKYPRVGPSSRYRVFQYIPYLEREGFECAVQCFHAPAYLEAFYGTRRVSPLYHAARVLRRIARLAAASRYDVVFIQKELFPLTPPLFEFAMHRAGVRFVSDIDDAVHLRYAGSPNPLVRGALGGKVPAVLRWSAAVLAGNEYLREYASRHNPATVLVPTVIDVDRYAAPPLDAAPRAARTRPVVVWIGSPETACYLAERGALFRRLSAIVPFTLRIIGAPDFTMPGVAVEAVPWREEREVEELRRCDIGVMPLPETPWTKGKCGLKLLQYMAAGLPVVTSPDGGARDIVTHGEQGFIARTDGEWIESLSALLSDASLRERLGSRGRRLVEERFSLRRWAPLLASILRRVAAGEAVGGDER